MEEDDRKKEKRKVKKQSKEKYNRQSEEKDDRHSEEKDERVCKEGMQFFSFLSRITIKIKVFHSILTLLKRKLRSFKVLL